MKLLILSILFIGCNTEYIQHTKEIPIEKEVFIDKEVEVIRYVPQDFEGIYYFKYGGQIELLVGYDQKIHIIRENQYIQSLNPKNDTVGGHPVIFSTLPLTNIGNTLRWTLNVNYGTSDMYDIEEDINGKDITSVRRTDFRIKLENDGNIELTIGIYKNAINKNTNYIVVYRILNSI